MVSVQMALMPEGRQLLGIDRAAADIRYQAVAQAIAVGELVAAGQAIYQLNWVDRGLYPIGTIESGMIPVAEAPAWEGGGSAGWSDLFPRLAANVSVQVRVTYGEFEGWWCCDDAARKGFRQLFTTGSSVSVVKEVDAVHNLSLGNAAHAYYSKVLAFLEECLQRRDKL
jgi:hypothetical protein